MLEGSGFASRWLPIAIVKSVRDWENECPVLVVHYPTIWSHYAFRFQHQVNSRHVPACASGYLSSSCMRRVGGLLIG